MLEIDEICSGHPVILLHFFQENRNIKFILKIFQNSLTMKCVSEEDTDYQKTTWKECKRSILKLNCSSITI